MKRVCALVLCVALLAGCGIAAEPGETEDITETTTEVIELYSDGINITETATIDPKWNERFPLVAALPEDDIYLYWIQGKNFNGKMVLFQEYHETIFDDWGYEKYDYPQLAYQDIDGDGTKEILVIAIKGGGTGMLLTDLHLLTVDTQITEYGVDYVGKRFDYVEYVFTNEEVACIINEKLSSKYGKQPDTLELSLGKEKLIIDKEDWIESSRVTVDYHIRFMFENNDFRVRAGVRAFNQPFYVAGITADVTFDGKRFGLTNIAFEPYLED